MREHKKAVPREEDGGVTRREEPTSPEAKAAFRQRTALLEVFQPENINACLAEVAAKKEPLEYPERALWEAVEVMMMDEVLRDRLLDKQSKGVKPAAEDRREYTRVISKYQVLVQFADREFHPAYATQQVIPYVKIGDLRMRLADMLANSEFYFPGEPAAEKDRREAFEHLKRQFAKEVQEGKKAELAVIGLLRHGLQWMWGGVQKDKQFLRPAVHVESAMPREDKLLRERMEGPGGQFQGADLIIKLDHVALVKALQIKTGEFIDKPGFANLAASHLVQAFHNLTQADFMTDKRLHDYGLTDQRMEYAAAMSDIVQNCGMHEDDQARLRHRVIGYPEFLRKKLLHKDAPPPGWSVTFKDLQAMLKQNKRFRDFATLHGVPRVIDTAMFSAVSNLIRQLRSEHAHEPFWQDWPQPPKVKKPKRDFEYVPPYARI